MALHFFENASIRRKIGIGRFSGYESGQIKKIQNGFDVSEN